MKLDHSELLNFSILIQHLIHNIYPFMKKELFSLENNLIKLACSIIVFAFSLLSLDNLQLTSSCLSTLLINNAFTYDVDFSASFSFFHPHFYHHHHLCKFIVTGNEQAYKVYEMIKVKLCAQHLFQIENSE